MLVCLFVPQRLHRVYHGSLPGRVEAARNPEEQGEAQAGEGQVGGDRGRYRTAPNNIADYQGAQQADAAQAVNLEKKTI